MIYVYEKVFFLVLKKLNSFRIMTTVAEENIIKKRLLIEGDSGNEDKLINKLTKSFIKWASYVQSEGADSDETTEALYEQMQISLSHAEFGLLRNHLIHDMNQMEQNNYKVCLIVMKFFKGHLYY